MYLDTTVKVERGKEGRMKPCVLVCQNDNGVSCLIARTLRKKNISGVYKIHPSKSRPAQTGGIAKLKTNQLNRQNITNLACTKQGQDLKKKKKKRLKVTNCIPCP